MPMPEHAAKLMPTPALLVEAINNGADPLWATEVEVADVLASVDTEALFTEERTQYEVVIWNRNSPINGVPAEHFLTRTDVPAEGEIFLLMHNGSVQLFQPHDPEHPGHVPVPTGKGLERGSRMADVISSHRAGARLSDHVREKIRQKRASEGGPVPEARPNINVPTRN